MSVQASWLSQSLKPGKRLLMTKPCILQGLTCQTSFGRLSLLPVFTPGAGNIATWKVKVGDEVTAGDSMAEVETDKATMDWESQEVIIGRPP